MNLFRKDIIDPLKSQNNAMNVEWQSVDIISSNCPNHIGVKLARLSDGTFQCPKGNEVYKPHGNLSNQTSRDRYDLNIGK